MKKSTKGALAGSAAALLLMGGVGTHASWSGDGTVAGTAVATGHLDLDLVSCDGWLISGSLSDPASVKIAPGGKLTQVCRFKVDAGGAEIKATLAVTSTDFADGSDSALTSALTTAVAYKDTVTGDPIAATTELSDGAAITATINVTLPADADESVQDLSATLDSITVTANQVV